ncbi:hypothetical protein J7J63_07010 [Candidatus Bipolaricaulota bacterium]|nr:hypothetical protein [Candidatus Bipolaricaulota bacterium]
MTTASEQNQNPYDICTWRPISECADCSLKIRLKCRFKKEDLLHFMAMFWGFAIPAIIGVIRAGYGWWLLGWFAFAMFFFNVWESCILCSHCPYYAEKGSTLHCIANYGSVKPWKYRPGPMSRAEKAQLWIGFVILTGFPFPFLLLGRQWALAFIALWGLILFFWTLNKYTCSQCVNFSCPLNRVPKEVVDAYLQRNPTMSKAWEASGWQPELPPPHPEVKGK